MKTKARKNPYLLLFIACVCACAMIRVDALALSEAASISESDGYTERVTRVYVDGEADDELTLRFYDAAPHVAYLGMDAYFRYMWNRPLTLRKNEDGTCSVMKANGAELYCDPDAGKIVVPDWNRFFVTDRESKLSGETDFNFPFSHCTNIEYLDAPQSVTLDFAAYGIALYVDEDDIYLPVSVLTNLIGSTGGLLLYNGENLYAKLFDSSYSFAEQYYTSGWLKEELQGQARLDDLIRECYAELCFNFDTFYGHPGVARLDGDLAEKGLDAALRDLGEEGEALRAGLLSSDLTEYISAINKLFMVYLDDGHCSFVSRSELSMMNDTYPLFFDRFQQDLIDYLPRSMKTMDFYLHENIPLQRSLLWGDEVYREYGSTAIIRVNGFYLDLEAWRDYYRGTGALPQDDLGIVISGLRRASENPKITNVLFDLSCAEGGYINLAVTIQAMTTGQTYLRTLQRLTGQRMIWSYEVDMNLDGVFDERDREPIFHFHYGVLATRYGFSASNLFPVMMQEQGAVLLGEYTDGGSCSIRMGCDAEGLCYYYSDADLISCDENWNDIEGGCKIDLPIKAVASDLVKGVLYSLGSRESLPLFNNYYDEEALDRMMNDWFQTAADTE